MEKRCHHCDTKKDVSEFNKNKATYDGLETYCRLCSKEIRRSVEFKNRASKRSKWAGSMMRHIKPNGKDY